MISQVTKADDDDFQEFQEAPKSGLGEQAFAEFQGESAAAFPTTIAPPHQNWYIPFLSKWLSFSLQPKLVSSVWKQV